MGYTGLDWTIAGMFSILENCFLLNIWNMKIYLSGKVTGEDYAQVCLKFKKYENKLSEMGHEVVNPVSHIESTDTWESAMKKAIILMMPCDTIFMIEDWLHSRGAKIEFELAYKLKFQIITPNDLDCMEHYNQ
jgi:hypothetical protein